MHTNPHTHTQVCVIGRQDRSSGLEGRLAFCFFSMQWPFGDSMLWACSGRLQICRDLLLSKTDGRTGMTVLSFTSRFKWMELCLNQSPDPHSPSWNTFVWTLSFLKIILNGRENGMGLHGNLSPLLISEGTTPNAVLWEKGVKTQHV